MARKRTRIAVLSSFESADRLPISTTILPPPPREPLAQELGLLRVVPSNDAEYIIQAYAHLTRKPTEPAPPSIEVA